MKNFLTITLCMVIGGLFTSNAQTTYTAAAGIGVDFGEGSTFVGPSGKYFFAEKHAVQGEILFSTGVTVVTALYEYHGGISGADGLQWFGGGGLSLLLGTGVSVLALRPVVGLDYKINNVPLVVSLDWRPAIGLGENLGSSVANFGLGVRYVFE